jgi:hypothetical protein
MDTGFKLEHVLRHLKHAEPAIEHWQKFGNVDRSAVIDGVLANAGALNRDLPHLVDGLVVAVHLLAKRCAGLEREIQRLESWGRMTHGTKETTNERG